ALALIGTVPDGYVTSLKILNGSIDTVDIAADAITGLLIADGTIDVDDIANGAVSGLKLADSAVSSAKIVNGSIDGVDIANGAIALLQLGNGAVDGSIIAAGSVGAGHLDAALSALLAQIGVIADNSITSAKIVNGTIAAEDIVSGAIG